jgi:phosphoglycerate kinase
MALRTIDDLEVSGKRVLVRCDLNVPLDDGRVVDDLRIRAAIPTIRTLLERGAKPAICSHLGRPKGKVVPELSLAPVAAALGELLGRPVAAVEDVIGEEAQEACRSDAEVVVLENLRFEPGEERNDPALADALAGLADAYVDDAFGAAHRAHASIVGVAERLPSAAGLLLVDEVDKLSRVLESPARPYVAVLGGAKVSDKLAVIGNLLDRVDAIAIGGAMAFTLLVARGEEVGRSLVERERVDEVATVLKEADANGVDILLPTDVVAADSPDEGADHETVPLAEIGDRMGVDVGPATARAFGERIEGASTVLWNGPMGIFEIEDYAGGTRAVVDAIARATKNGAFTVAGGGDSAAALKKFGMADAVSHLSTGGGASLEFLEGKELPGIAVLQR